MCNYAKNKFIVRKFGINFTPASPTCALWAILTCTVSVVLVYNFFQPVWFTGTWPGHQNKIRPQSEKASLNFGLFTFCKKSADLTIYYCEGYSRLYALNIEPSFVWQTAIISMGIGSMVLLLTACLALFTLFGGDLVNKRIANIVANVQLYGGE